MIYIFSPHYLFTEKAKIFYRMQSEFINRYTDEDKDSYKYVRLESREGMKHIRALGNILKWLKLYAKEGDLVIVMDSDAFPFRKGWIEKTENYLNQHNDFVAVQRMENPYHYRRIPHPCFCAWHHGTKINFRAITNNPYIEGWENRKWKSLHRSNSVNYHQQLYAIYDNFIYHHGAASRNVNNNSFFSKGLKFESNFFKDPEHFIRKMA